MEISILSLSSSARIIVNAKIDEGHQIEALPSRFSVENADIVTEHIVIQPRVVTIEFELNNQGLPGISFLGSDLPEGDALPHQGAVTLFELMTKALDARDLYEVVTQHALYRSMALINVSANNRAPLSGTLSGVLVFQSVNLPKNRAELTQTLVKKTVEKVNSGRIPSQAANDAQIASIAKTFGGT